MPSVIFLIVTQFCLWPAEYPQDKVDAALASFQKIAGAENAALLRKYVAAILGRSSTDPAESTGATAQTDDAPAIAAGTNADAGAELVQPGSGLPAGPATAIAGATDSVAPATSAAAEAPAPQAEGEPVAAVDGDSKARPQLRWPRSIKLQPISAKQTRSEVHEFFRTDERIPPFRTETQQQKKKSAASPQVRCSLPLMALHAMCHGVRRCCTQ